MLDPRIALATTVPNVGQSFGNALTSIQKLDSIKENRDNRPMRDQLMQQNVSINEQNLKQGQSNQYEAQNQARLKSVVQGAIELNPYLASGNVEGAKNNLMQRRERLVQQGLPTQDTDQALQMLTTPEGVAQLRAISEQSIQMGEQLRNMGGQKSQFQRGANGQVFDTKDGSSVYDPAFRENQEQLNQQQLSHNAKLIDQQTSAEHLRKNNELTLKRNSDIIGENKKKYQTIAGQNRRVNRALKLASQATQGYGGALQLQAARIFPDMDVSNEASLDQAFTELAMDVLSKFKGPTTDFEFGVAQTIPGKLTDGRSGNVAKLKSIKRSLWFLGEEDRQFNAHLKSKGAAEDFRFNMLKEVKTKSGMYKLEDLQATAVENHLTIEEVIQRLNQ